MIDGQSKNFLTLLPRIGIWNRKTDAQAFPPNNRPEGEQSEKGGDGVFSAIESTLSRAEMVVSTVHSKGGDYEGVQSLFKGR